MLKTLTPREEKVIKMRFGLDDGSEHTLEEVGQSFAVTRERIRQIEAKALRKLRHPLARPEIAGRSLTLPWESNLCSGLQVYLGGGMPSSVEGIAGGAASVGTVPPILQLRRAHDTASQCRKCDGSLWFGAPQGPGPTHKIS